MRLYLFQLLLGLGIGSVVSTGNALAQAAAPDDGIHAAVIANQFDLDGNGRQFLLGEAGKNDFFLLGELHGDSEIPALLEALWPELWKQGYHHVAGELSPWAANQLEHVPAGAGPEIQGLWTKHEATVVHGGAAANATVLWGCDMEEEQLPLLIRELASLNRGDASLKEMVTITQDGYSRKLAPRLLELTRESKSTGDRTVNDVSLRQNILDTLEIETNRLNPATKMIAQNEREMLMKRLLLAHLRVSPLAQTKIFLRFGRNHLHRGYDERGISTLGNFIAEWAVGQGRSTFNVGAFGAGGKATLMGETFDADEREDELTFAFLAGQAKYTATVFDLRPLRPLLHGIPREKRTALETNLIFWADAYDALICYKNVTPRKP